MCRRAAYRSLKVSPFLSMSKVWGCLLILGAASLLRASELPPSFTLDFPVAVNLATPIWLGHPVAPATTFATLDLPIMPPDANASLLVTVFYQEKEGGFLRVTWQTSSGSQTLSDNLYEGIGMNNQRSLLIAPDVMNDDGTLHFQVGATDLGIQRIKLEWLENRNGLVSPQVQDLLVTPEQGATQPAQNLNGQLKLADPAAWLGQIVNVPIIDQPQRIEQGVEFAVQLDSVPGSARLVLKEAGLAWEQCLVVWINQHRAGRITPAVPDLSDEGFLPATSSVYIGWRKGSLYVPVTLLKADVNTVQISVENDVPSDQGNTGDPSNAPILPLAIKDAVLQLNYPTPSTSPTTPDVSSSTTPTDTPAPPLPSLTVPPPTNTP